MAGQLHVEPLFLVFESAYEYAGAEHEEQVADNGARDARFHHIEQSLAYEENGNDQFRGVAEGGIQEAPEPLSRVVGDALGRFPQEARHEQDRQRRDDEFDDGPEVGVVANAA